MAFWKRKRSESSRSQVRSLIVAFFLVRKINSKKVVFDSKMQSAQHRVNSARGAFNRAMNKLRNWEGKVQRLCTIKHCGSGKNAGIFIIMIIIIILLQCVLAVLE